MLGRGGGPVGDIELGSTGQHGEYLAIGQGFGEKMYVDDRRVMVILFV